MYRGIELYLLVPTPRYETNNKLIPSPSPTTHPFTAYRAVLNLYGAMGSSRQFSRASDAEALTLGLPPSWTSGRAYRVNDGGLLGGDAPLMVSFTRGDHMLAVIRGTVFAREWCVASPRWIGRKRGKDTCLSLCLIPVSPNLNEQAARFPVLVGESGQEPGHVRLPRTRPPRLFILLQGGTRSYMWSLSSR